MVHPTHGERRPVFDFEQVRESEREQERAERLRLYYVAMTRAIDRLIVSGAIDHERAADRETPIGWVLDRLDAREVVGRPRVRIPRSSSGETRGSSFAFTARRGRQNHGASSSLRCRKSRQDSSRSSPSCLSAPLLSGSSCPRSRPRLLRRSTMFAACRTARLRSSSDAPTGTSPSAFWACRPSPRDAASTRAESGLAGTEIGDAVHRLLEEIPLDAPASPARAELEASVRAWYPAVSEAELDRIAGLVEAYCRSPLALRIATLADARPERPFAFEHDGVLLHGRLDVLWRENGNALVVDYKSNLLDGADPREIVEADYRLQRLVYALACLRDGAQEVEVAYQFLERPDDVVSATFSADDLPELEAELSDAISRIRAGVFVPTPSEFACSDCPALDLVCAGPRLRTWDAS